mmetsp:Transcript_10107/g.20462  ORF Transcript_10107/g.20462 Transcript_10107/m.20462 type:complete len:233 (+) Transcript_10107:143-841(+)
MGCLLSCFETLSDKVSAVVVVVATGSSKNGKETEMMAHPTINHQNGSGGKTLSISRSMTAPTIEVKDNGLELSGTGLALVGATVEQDAAYWECHVEIPGNDDAATAAVAAYEVMFGVATKKDRKFYDALMEQEEESPDSNGTDLMRKIPVKNGSVVGVAVQQVDLPMVQFLLDGEPLHTLSINRFRGNVHPAVYVPENEEGLTVKLVFNESAFSQMSPAERFGPLIIARGII